MIDGDDCGAFGWMNTIGKGNRSTRRKPALVPLCPPRIPPDLTRARTGTAAVGRWRLAVWARHGTAIFMAVWCSSCGIRTRVRNCLWLRLLRHQPKDAIVKTRWNFSTWFLEKNDGKGKTIDSGSYIKSNLLMDHINWATDPLYIQFSTYLLYAHTVEAIWHTFTGLLLLNVTRTTYDIPHFITKWILCSAKELGMRHSQHI
jgi:hypothetical protein